MECVSNLPDHVEFPHTFSKSAHYMRIVYQAKPNDASFLSGVISQSILLLTYT